MKIAGIIAEYNPFHTGHDYHIRQTRERTGADAVAVMMSGNFVQRGGPAVADKWTRAHAAVDGGADIVFELPTYYAHATAQLFACGAVKSLMYTGAVDYLSFGTETEDFLKIAETVVERSWFIEGRLQNMLTPGMPYPVAYAKAVEAECGIGADIISAPNNMLALEYYKVLARERSSIEPVCIQRQGAGYHDMQAKGGFVSASALRKMLEAGENWSVYMPPAVAQVYKDAYQHKDFPVSEKQFDNALLSVLRRLPDEFLCGIADMPSAGFENRISEMANKAGSVAELISLCMVKQYTASRVRRIIWNCFLGVPNLGYDIEPTYLRVLAMNETGKTALRKIKDCASLPIVTKTADFEKDELFSLDLRASDMYYASAKQTAKRTGNVDYLRSPIVL